MYKVIGGLAIAGIGLFGYSTESNAHGATK